MPEVDFPLFPLGIVALPGEAVPLHIFEERYRMMFALLEAEEREFAVVLTDDEGERDIGCACRLEEILERLPDGRLNVLTRGTRPVEIVLRSDDRPFPSGVVEELLDSTEEPDTEALGRARESYATLIEHVTDERPPAEDLATLDSWEMAGRIDFGTDAKQGLLELRSENARLDLLTRLLRAAIRRLEWTDRAQARAASNGKVKFG